MSPVGAEPAAAAGAAEGELLARLRAGDEQAFRSLVEANQGSMMAVAAAHVRTPSLAEEVVQEAWLGVLNGIDRFEGRSTLRTWILRIVMNTAMRRGTREARSVPFSSLAAADAHEPAVEPERFRRPGEPYPGHWQAFPGDWGSVPDQRLLDRETLELLKRTIEGLPPAQRKVVTMRDVAGCSAGEVCDLLEITATNQRVLLHRARSKLRAALEMHLDA